MLSLRITPQAMSRIQSQRRMSAFVIFFLLLFLPASSSPALFGSSSKTLWISCDRQLPEGSGFLVSDNYPLEYSHNLSCVYTIPLQAKTHGTSAICLRFQRFRLEKIQDYLEIHGQPWMQKAPGSGKHHEFTGLGEISNPSHPGGFSSVWEDSFCWIPNHGEACLKLVFHSDISESDLGFYASYKTVTMEQIQSESNMQVTTAEVGVGRSCGVVCFDRSCSGGDACPSSAAGGCADRSDRSYAHSRCKTASNAPAQVPGQLACDFELPGCGSLWTGERMWQRTSRNHDPVYGPSSGRSFYMVKDFSNSRADWLGDITVAVPTSREGETQCLSFWYHMHGPDVGQLQIYWQDPLRAKGALWNRAGSYGNYWHHTQLSLFIQATSKNNNIIFSANRGSEYRAQFAIDDLSLMEGPCPYYDDISCTFNDHHLCDWKWSANTTPIMLAGRNVILRHHCLAPSCGGGNTSSGVLLTSPPVAIGGHTCLILHYRFKVKHGELVVRRSLQVIKEQSSMVDDNTGWRRAKYTISPPVGNASISSRIEIESNMSIGGVFDMEEITFVPISCDKISLGSCENGQFRCRLTGTCVSKNVLCNKIHDCGMVDDSDEANCQYKNGCYGQFECDNQVCIDNAFTCNGFNDCGDNSDEKNCDSPARADSSYSPVALIALVAGCILILLIVIIKIGLCLHVRYKRRRLLRLRDRRLEALRSMGRCNSIDSLRPDLMPPAYADCIRDNPAFVLGEESEGEDKRDLPSYSQVLEGRYLMITNPVKSELQRLRMEMQERPAEEGTSTADQQDHQAHVATIVAGENAVVEATVAGTSSGSGYQDSQGQSVESSHQRLSIEIENQGPPLEFQHQTTSIESGDYAPPVNPYHQEPILEPADYVPSVEQDQRLTLHQFHHRPTQQPPAPIQLSHNADDTDRDIATGVQCVEAGLQHQRQPVETEVLPSPADPQVQTHAHSHHQFIDNMEEPTLARETPVCTEEQGHMSANSVPPVHASESGGNASSLQIIKDAPIYMLPHDSCPTHVSLAIWDDSEIHV